MTAAVLPQPLDYHEKSRLRAAAYHAKRALPGPVGELVARELLAAADFGYRFGGQATIGALVEDVLRREVSQ